MAFLCWCCITILSPIFTLSISWLWEYMLKYNSYSLRLNVITFHPWTKSSLVQVRACCPFCTISFSQTNIDLLSFIPLRTILDEVLSKYANFHSRKYIWKLCLLLEWQPFCLGNYTWNKHNVCLSLNSLLKPDDCGTSDDMLKHFIVRKHLNSEIIFIKYYSFHVISIMMI